jgi:hypothetical protein
MFQKQVWNTVKYFALPMFRISAQQCDATMLDQGYEADKQKSHNIYCYGFLKNKRHIY